MIRRDRKDSEQEYNRLCECESWEVPWVKVLYQHPTRGSPYAESKGSDLDS